VPLLRSVGLQAASSYTNFHFYYQACMAVSLQSGGVQKPFLVSLFSDHGAISAALRPSVFLALCNPVISSPKSVPSIRQSGGSRCPAPCSDRRSLLPLPEPSAVLTANRIARAQQQLGASRDFASALADGRRQNHFGSGWVFGPKANKKGKAITRREGL
jgi:hypothetical protein